MLFELFKKKKFSTGFLHLIYSKVSAPYAFTFSVPSPEPHFFCFQLQINALFSSPAHLICHHYFDQSLSQSQFIISDGAHRCTVHLRTVCTPGISVNWSPPMFPLLSHPLLVPVLCFVYKISGLVSLFGQNQKICF